MRTEQFHCSQVDFTNLTNLGALIGKSEKRPSNLMVVAGAWLAGGILIGGLLAIGDGTNGWGWSGLGLGILFSVLGIATDVVERLSGKTADRTLRVHENGLCLLQSGIATWIYYNELEEIRFKKTMVYGESLYHSTNFELETKSYISGESKTINWSEANPTGAKNSIDFDALHLRLSETVADNMAAKLEIDQKTPWGNSTFFYHNGIEARVKTGIFSSKTTFFPWSELEEMKFSEGKLLLCFESATVEIHHGEPNMFSGYILVERQVKTIYENSTINLQTEEEVELAMADREEFYVGGNP